MTKGLRMINQRVFVNLHWDGEAVMWYIVKTGGNKMFEKIFRKIVYIVLLIAMNCCFIYLMSTI